MGSGTFDPKAYASFTRSTTNKTTDEIYTSRDINKNLDPKNIKVRESRDSTDNPKSTPIIVALDVTGSMGMIADVIAREGLGTLFTGILDRKPVTDPHVMFMGVGDATCDSAPLQVSQFEADKSIIEQLTQLYLEHGGGGNNFESYNLPWYFAANHTVHDSFEKRAKRGYLFTIGDEKAPEDLTKEQIKRIFCEDTQANINTKELLENTQRFYDVFHIIIKEGNYAQHNLAGVVDSWLPLLGQQRVIQLSDHKKLAETIVSAIEVAEGIAAHDSAARWGGATAKVVNEALENITAAKKPKLLRASA
jgi:hypothetical protein